MRINASAFSGVNLGGLPALFRDVAVIAYRVPAAEHDVRARCYSGNQEIVQDPMQGAG